MKSLMALVFTSWALLLPSCSSSPTGNSGSGELQPFAPDATTMALWHLDEPSGSSVMDVSANRDSGQAFGTIIVAGRFGNGRYLNGASDYIFVPSPGNGAFDFSPMESFTVDIYIKTTAFDGVIIRRGLAPLPGFMLSMNVGHVVARIGNQVGQTWNDTLLTLRSTDAFNDNLWHHISLVRDRVQQKMFLYVDEKAATTPITDSCAMPLISARPLTIGRWENGAEPGYIAGAVDEIRISRRAIHP